MKLPLLFFLFLYGQAVFAGAWNQKKGSGILLNTFLYAPSADGSPFEWNPYGEFGVSDIFTVGANVGYRRSTNSFGYAEGLVRYHLTDGPLGVLSVQGSVGTAARGLGAAGDGSAESVEVRIQWGLGTEQGRWGSAYFDLQSGYREYFGKVGDEWRTDFTIGWKFLPEWIFLGQLFWVQNLRTTLAPQDYNSLRLRLSLVVPIADNWKFQLGCEPLLSGTQVENRLTYLLGVWFQW